MQITLEQILSALPSFDLETRIEIAKAALNAEEVAEQIRKGEMKTMTWDEHLKKFEGQKRA